MFSFEHISLRYHGKSVLSDISFSCKPGEVLGILGPHSSGKSALLKILAGLIEADSGKILYNRKEVKSNFRNYVAYLPEERGLYQQTNVLELLIYFGMLRGMDKYKAEVEAIRFLDRFQLVQKSKERICELERAELQKVEIIAALIHNPDIIIFDEPFKDLDINNQRILMKILESQVRANKIVIIGTHNMELAEQLCGNILLLNHGESVLSGNSKHILQQYCDDYITLVISEETEYEDYLLNRPDISDYYSTNGELRIFLKKKASKKKFLTEISKDLLVYKYETARPSLKDLFLKKIPMQEYKEKQAIDDQIF